jgi:hypothetical protein
MDPGQDLSPTLGGFSHFTFNARKVFYPFAIRWGFLYKNALQNVNRKVVK